MDVKFAFKTTQVYLSQMAGPSKKRQDPGGWGSGVGGRQGPDITGGVGGGESRVGLEKLLLGKETGAGLQN